MSSLPPVGGTTRRSLFAVWVAAVVSLANRRIAAPPRLANRSQVFNIFVGEHQQPLSPSAKRQATLQTARITFGNCASAAAGLQAPT
jgi:hypothetical protein